MTAERGDLEDRIALALSTLGHCDEAHWRQQVDRAVLALRGASIDELRQLTAEASG